MNTNIVGISNKILLSNLFINYKYLFLDNSFNSTFETKFVHLRCNNIATYSTTTQL